MDNPKVGIVMGSDSDLQVMLKAADVLKEFGIPYEMKVMSAHRTPAVAAEFAGTAHTRGIRVIIAGAGMAAHLAGAMAASSPLPIIGIPIQAKQFDGMDALLSTVQMPPGVPVATVAVNGAKNAGLLAVQILSTADDALRDKFIQYKKDMAEASLKKNANLKID